MAVLLSSAEHTAYNSASFGELKAATAVARAGGSSYSSWCATPLHCAGVERWRKCAARQAWLHTTAAQWSTVRGAVARYRLPVLPTALHCELTVARQSGASRRRREAVHCELKQHGSHRLSVVV